MHCQEPTSLLSQMPTTHDGPAIAWADLDDIATLRVSGIHGNLQVCCLPFLSVLGCTLPAFERFERGS